jgi:hypothetical protein
LSGQKVYWEDIVIGAKERSGVTVATEEEMLAFARQFERCPCMSIVPPPLPVSSAL